MMTVEYWRWWITDETTGKRTKSRWHMSAETARNYLNAQPVDGTMQMRQVPEPGEIVPPHFNPGGPPQGSTGSGGVSEG